jgi:hypothetical protein
MSCTVCLDQLLECDSPDQLAILNNNGSPSAFENGLTPIPLGAQTVAVFFTTEKLSSSYTFNEMAVQNTIDNTPLNILAALTSSAVGGFTVALSGITDTANYVLKWEVEVIIV